MNGALKQILPCVLLFAGLSRTIGAQQTAPSDTNPDPNSQRRVPDGGSEQVLQSIFIPPLQNAPFSATVHTEWTRPMPGGGTFTVTNQRQVARDSAGHVYQERWYLVPKGGKIESRLYLIQIADPIEHTLHSCYLLLQPHRCTLEDFRPSAMASYHPASAQTGTLPDGEGYLVHEDLGTKDVSGIETAGTRDTTTYNKGVIGNDQPFSVKREFWFSPALGVDLLSEVTSPTSGTQDFSVTNVNTSAPDPGLFQPPAGFQIVDRRKQAAPSGPAQ